MRHRRLAAVTVSVAAAAIHAGGLSAGFVFDDYRYLHRAQLGHPLLGATPFEIFRPLPEVWFFIGWRVFGNNPVAFHAATLTLIAGATYLMFQAASRLLRDDAAALCAAAFFGCHTAFEWVSQWTSVVQSALMLTFALGATLLSFRRNRSRWLAAPLGLAALLTRENAIMLPALIAVVAFATTPSVRKAIADAVPTAIALIPYALVRAIEGATSPPSGPYRAVFGAHIVDHGFQLAELTAQPFGRLPSGPWTVLFWGLAIALAVTSPMRRIGIAGLVWWLIAILPVTTPTRAMLPYYVDLALPGAALLVGAALTHLLDLLRYRPAFAGAIVACTIAFGMRAAPLTINGSFVNMFKDRSKQLLAQKPTGPVLIVHGSHSTDALITRDGDMWRIEFDQPRLVVEFDVPQGPTIGL